MNFFLDNQDIEAAQRFEQTGDQRDLAVIAKNAVFRRWQMDCERNIAAASAASDRLQAECRARFETRMAEFSARMQESSAQELLLLRDHQEPKERKVAFFPDAAHILVL